MDSDRLCTDKERCKLLLVQRQTDTPLGSMDMVERKAAGISLKRRHCEFQLSLSISVLVGGDPVMAVSDLLAS